MGLHPNGGVACAIYRQSSARTCASENGRCAVFSLTRIPIEVAERDSGARRAHAAKSLQGVHFVEVRTECSELFEDRRGRIVVSASICIPLCRGPSMAHVFQAYVPRLEHDFAEP